jgi:3-hydroxymyristoyl/3-hydroxydecanoyl-(acyl carrier protein) dehydratase
VIAHDLVELARWIAPRARRTSELEVELSERRRGRIVVATTQAINGKRILVQKRRAFAVFVGERPVKRS